MSATEFVYASPPMRVVFGAGSIRAVAAEVERLGTHRAVVLCTRDQRGSAEQVATLLASRTAGIFDGAVMHVPVDVIAEAKAFAGGVGATLAVAIGGGSTIGLAKMLALEGSLDYIAIPTTYAGSEMTPIHGSTALRLKKTGRDARVLPQTVLYDPELSSTLPVGLSVASGLNAIAHAAEALYARDGNPIVSLMAAESIRALAGGLRGVAAAPQSPAARHECLYGAWLAGTALGSVSMALHHKLCHTLGGTFDLPHAQTHAAVLPHAIAYNAPAVPEAAQAICRALQADHGMAGAALFDLAESLGAPLSLKELGLSAADLELAATLVLEDPYWNPRPLVPGALRDLLRDAFEGVRPGA